MHHGEKPETEYHMVYSENCAEGSSSLRFNFSENFHNLIHDEFLGKRLELAIIPVVKPEKLLLKQAVEGNNKYLLLYNQALKGIPIMIQTIETDLEKIALQAKFACVLPKYHSFRINLRKIIQPESVEGELPLYSREQFFMDVQTDVEDRFEFTRKFEGPLSDDYMTWNDVAGGRKNDESDRTVNERKRSLDSTGLPEDLIEEAKRPRSSNDSDLPIDILS